MPSSLKYYIIPFLILFFSTFSQLYPQNRYALIIGTNYQGNPAGIPPLELCEKDAKYLDSQVRKVGGFRDVNVLLGRQVTKANIEAAFKELASKVKKDDVVFIYFSGHGSKERDVNSPTGTRNYLVCFNRPHLYDHELDKLLSQIQSPKTVVVLDCCYSGGISKKGKATRGTGGIPIPQGLDGVVRQNHEDYLFQDKPIIASADSSQLAWEAGGNINHGIFTYNFGQALEKADLNKDEVITVLEAFFYAREGTIQMARKIGQEQTPQISGNASGVYLVGSNVPKPSKDATPPPKLEQKEPLPESAPPVESPVTPPTKVTNDEPPPQWIPSNMGSIRIRTTILSERDLVSHRGQETPRELIEKNRRNQSRGPGQNPSNSNLRRVLVLLNGEPFPFQLETKSSLVWGSYMSQGRIIPGNVYHILLSKVPAGVHQLKVLADDYPEFETAIGVIPNKENEIDLVTSLKNFGAIQGRVFYKTLDNPIQNHPIFMPTIVSTRGVQKVNTDKDGYFYFTNLKPGNYEIRASFAESLKLGNNIIQVKPGEVTKVDIILNVKLSGTKTKY